MHTHTWAHMSTQPLVFVASARKSSFIYQIAFKWNRSTLWIKENTKKNSLQSNSIWGFTGWHNRYKWPTHLYRLCVALYDIIAAIQICVLVKILVFSSLLSLRSLHWFKTFVYWFFVILLPNKMTNFAITMQIHSNLFE